MAGFAEATGGATLGAEDFSGDMEFEFPHPAMSTDIASARAIESISPFFHGLSI